MSVVNQMLKDLEQRQADEQGVSAVYQPSAKAKQVPLSWVVVIVLLLLMAGMVGWYLLDSQPRENAVVETNNLELPPAEVAEVAKAKPMAVKVTPVTEVQPPPAPAETAEVAIVTTTNTDIEQQAEALATAVVESVEEELSAAEVVETTADIAPATPTEIQTTASVFSKQSTANDNDAASLRERALAAVRAGQDELAIQLLEQLIGQEPTNTAARKKLAALLFAQGQAVRARIVLDAGIQLFPQDASMRLMLARLLEQQQQIVAAFEVLNPTVTLANVNSEYLGVRAAMADQLGEYVIAFEDYLRLTQLKPEQARWWLGLAIASERTNASAQALTAYQQAASMNQLSRDVQRFVQQRISLLVGSQ